jgi:hypothetical protein
MTDEHRSTAPRSTADHVRRWREERGELGLTRATLQRLRDALGVVELSEWADVTNARFETVEHDVFRLRESADGTERAVAVWAFMTWLEAIGGETDTHISVITPTRNRRPYLERAIASVFAQQHRNLELIVVDDASEDDTQQMLAAIEDPRLRVVESPGGGPCVARNLGLDHATGSIVAYLDDDNLMHPMWLRAVGWAFERSPEAELLYGARIIDDDEAIYGREAGGWPMLLFRRFDRAELEHTNLADQNVIAHRAGLPDARFDETLREYGDWDLFLRMTEHRVPMELPAIACCYSTAAPGRLTGSAEGPREIEHILAKGADPPAGPVRPSAPGRAEP